MARGRRRALVAPAIDMELSDSDKDPIDQHIAKRQALLEKQAQGSDSESELENAGFGGENEVAVCDIDLSSSDEDADCSDSENEVLQKPSAANLSDSDKEGAGEGENDSRDDEAWRGRRRRNYGADTEEFEIMEDEERTEALQEEEEEVLRLQRRSLATLEVADYAPEDESDAENAAGPVDGEASAAQKDVAHDATALALYESAPELASLIKECNKFYKQANIWKSRLEWGDAANVRFHLYSSYAINIAFYFALRTDPEAKGVDVRSHPVMKKILELRKLISLHETIEITEPSATPPIIEAIGTRAEKDNVPVQSGAIAVELRNGMEQPRKMETKEEPRARRKLKKERKRAKAAAAEATATATVSEDVDDNFIQGLLQRSEQPTVVENMEQIASDKRRRLNRITGAIDSEAKNDQKRRLVSVDADYIRAPTDAKPAKIVTPLGNTVGAGSEEELDTLDDGSFVNRVLKKKEHRELKKKAPAGPHHYSFKDAVDPGARRRASTQVVLNRGLVRYRPKEKKTPRTKNKLAYANAVKRRKGMVRDAVAVKPGLSYGGEASGINVSSRRGTRLSDV